MEIGIVISVVFVIIGLVMTLINVKKCYFSNYIEVEGNIVNWEKKEDYNKEDGYSVTYAPIIEYQVDGKTYEYISKVSSSIKPKIGKKVQLMYDPNNPNKCVKKNDLSGLVFVIIGIVFIVICLKMSNQ